MREGMAALGVLEALKASPGLQQLFSGGPPPPLTAEAIKQLFNVPYSVPGSSRRVKEERAVAFFWDWLADVEGMSHT